MKSFIGAIEKCGLSQAELFKTAKVLNSSYNPLMSDKDIWILLKALFPSALCDKYINTLEGHEAANQILMKYYSGERVIKYYLARERLSVEDEITVFELPINSSRLDVGRINGESYVFEIKTEYDSLSKITRQIDDYSKAFEYVCIVVHPKHLEKALELIPEFCGVRTYEIDVKGCTFSEIRKPQMSINLDRTIQENNLSSKDLENILRDIGVKGIPGTKEERLTQVQALLDAKELNHHFKEAIKSKFSQRWQFLCENFNSIKPIDIQVFYQTSADPFWVYYKNSCIV